MNPYDDESVINILMDDMETTLNNELIFFVGDATKAGLIRAGNLQDDPTVLQTNILIHRGDKDWKDTLNVGNDNGVYAPTFEVGGTQYWWRRFIVEMEFFFDGELDRPVARRKANIILPRLQQSLFKMPMPTNVDNFGEQAHTLIVRNLYMTEGGGEGEFIWSGKIWVEVLTTIRG